MQAKIPVFAVTDPNTDIGKVIVNGGFGWWCESDDSKKFFEIIKKINYENLVELGNNGFNYLRNYYSSELGYRIIADYIKE